MDLAANGVRPAVVDIDAEAVERPAPHARRSRASTASSSHGDARDPEVLEPLFRAVDERWGRLDILVNVVGGTFQCAVHRHHAPRAWDALLRTNLTHVLHACSSPIPRMRAGGRGGSIVNVTTIEAHRAAPGFAVYSAAKAGVEQFARTLAVELAPDGIRVNNVAPDVVPTPNMAKLARRRLGRRPRRPRRSGIAMPMARIGRSHRRLRAAWCSSRPACPPTSPARRSTPTEARSRRRDGSTGPRPAGPTSPPVELIEDREPNGRDQR